MNQTRELINAYETGPSPGCLEVTLGSSDVDVTAIGGYPVRLIEIITAGSGTLIVQTAISQGADVTMSGLTAGYQTPPAQFRLIHGTGGGSNVTKIRVWK